MALQLTDKQFSKMKELLDRTTQKKHRAEEEHLLCGVPKSLIAIIFNIKDYDQKQVRPFLQATKNFSTIQRVFQTPLEAFLNEAGSS